MILERKYKNRVHTNRRVHITDTFMDLISISFSWLNNSPCVLLLSIVVRALAALKFAFYFSWSFFMVHILICLCKNGRDTAIVCVCGQV